MQEYKKIIIGKDEIIPVAERMRKEGRYLVMIHAFFNKDGEADIIAYQMPKVTKGRRGRHLL